MSVTLPFEFDGVRFKHGRLIFMIRDEARVEGADFDVPVKYAMLMLRGVEGAGEFFDEVACAPLRKSVKAELLEKAVKEGIGSARMALQAYLREAPNGRPRFYRGESERKICLLDGSFSVEFYAGDDLLSVASRLPRNVYCVPKWTCLEMDLARFQQASSEIDEFFGFMKRLMSCSNHVAERTISKCFNMYFADKSEAYRLLKMIEGEAGYRAERDKVFEDLRREEVLRCKGGFVVSTSYFEVFYVTDEGRVYRLAYTKPVSLREAVIRLVKKGERPKNLVEVEDRDELLEIARVVGRVCPQLVPVIAP